MDNEKKRGAKVRETRHAAVKPPAPEAPQPAEKPVSMHPLEFEEAVRGLLTTGTKNKNGQREDV